MNTRQQSMLKNMAPSNRRIYDCIPIQDYWKIVEIQLEYRRLYGTHPPLNSVEKVLKDCFDQGLIKQSGSSKLPTYKREASEPKETVVKVLTQEQAEQVKAVPIEIHERIRLLSSQLLDLASELSSLAQEVQDQSKPSEELIKLRKMKETFKSFMGD